MIIVNRKYNWSKIIQLLNGPKTNTDIDKKGNDIKKIKIIHKIPKFSREEQTQGTSFKYKTQTLADI